MLGEWCVLRANVVRVVSEMPRSISITCTAPRTSSHTSRRSIGALTVIWVPWP